MVASVYNSAKLSFGKGELAWVSDTVSVSLHDNTFSVDVDGDTYFSDISSSEISGGGYTSGGEDLGSKTATQDDTNDRAKFDGADIQITSFTNTFRYVVVRQDTGTDSTSRLITAYDIGADKTISNGIYDITWPASGVFTLN